jgi:hypothetical protein
MGHFAVCKIFSILLTSLKIFFFPVIKQTYATSCSFSAQCNDSAGLTCPITCSTCNCPIASSSIFCDCSQGYYFDYGLNMCSELHFPKVFQFLWADSKI